MSTRLYNPQELRAVASVLPLHVSRGPAAEAAQLMTGCILALRISVTDLCFLYPQTL